MVNTENTRSKVETQVIEFDELIEALEEISNCADGYYERCRGAGMAMVCECVKKGY